MERLGRLSGRVGVPRLELECHRLASVPVSLQLLKKGG